jgi:biotin carboxyl carrier protein
MRMSVLPLAATAIALALTVPTASASSGGATVPTGGASISRDAAAHSGGAGYGTNLPPAARPIAASLSLAARKVRAGSEVPAVSFRVVQPGMQRVQARVVVQRAAGHAPVLRRSVGWVSTDRRVTVRWRERDIAPRSGRYVVRLHVKDSRGRTLQRTSARPGRTLLRVTPAPVPAPAKGLPAPAPVAPGAVLPAPAPSPGGRGTFPVVGAFTFGGPDSRFGVGRPGHTHEGQDIAAGAGQPVVAPYAGTVSKTSYQASGAGEYVVLDAVDGRDYFFAHCTRGSTSVRTGQPVGAGTPLCRVGSTGTSSGPHLHFEIWTTGWRVPGGAPIDPLPELRAWAGA